MSEVERERRDGVLVITLNRPEVRNAVNAALARGVAEAIDELEGFGRASSPARVAPSAPGWT